jgi:predicted transcriptional regulator
LRTAGCTNFVVPDENLTQEMLNAANELVRALRDAQGALEHLIEGVTEIRARAERGEEIDEVLRRADLDGYRHVVDEGMEVFEVWRRVARGSAIRAALAAGMTLTDIAEEFGFSRTYARRLAREPSSPPG